MFFLHAYSTHAKAYSKQSVCIELAKKTMFANNLALWNTVLLKAIDFLQLNTFFLAHLLIFCNLLFD
jgi:hypothetical protein